MTMFERAEVIQACRYVDEIILAPPSVVPKSFMETHKIDLIVHGNDCSEKQLMHFYGDAIQSGKYKDLPYTTTICTTDILNRITSRTPEELQRKYYLK